METLNTIYQRIITDGHNNYPNGFRTDKGTIHNYISVYETLLTPYRNRPISLLEIGIDYGWSLKLWKDYLHPNSKIYGNDIHDVLEYREVEQIVIANSIDPNTPRMFNTEFDIIIDDSNHEIEYQLGRFPLWFPKLKTGGTYIIEDIDNLDNTIGSLRAVHPSCEIYDLRPVKNRYDDVIVTYKK